MYGITTIIYNGAHVKVDDFPLLARSYLIKDGTSTQSDELQAIILAMASLDNNRLQRNMCIFYTLMDHCQWAV